MKELVPTNGRKSFYGKAMIKKTTKGEVLESYGHPIIVRKQNGELVPIINPIHLSRTTCIHLKAFCGITKAQYIKLYNTQKTNEIGII